MKRIYFAGKFDLSGGGESLADRLRPDYRSALLGDSRLLTRASRELRLPGRRLIYQGCFYCEEASAGDFTSTDCDAVVRAETAEILAADVFCCVLDENFSVGSVVELMDALHADKRIAIFYRSERTRYEIKSEYWFAITRAMHLARERGLTLEVFCYEHDLLAHLARWLDALEAQG